MTKIDTKEIRNGSGGCNYTTINMLCDAYDEAQREIFEIKKLASSFQKKLDDFGRESIEHISTLEGLLSEILNVEFWGSQCSVCGMPKQILGDGLNIQNHKPDCLFTRIKKEKNWGNEHV